MTETGAVARVTREDLTVLSLDVPLDLEQVQQAWPRFEASLDSLQGRRMMGLVFNRQGVYRLATSKLARDRDHSYGLDETVVPGGEYLRLTLVGTPPGLYSRIGAAFDTLFEQADHDPDRPLIEFYRREGEGRLPRAGQALRHGPVNSPGHHRHGDLRPRLPRPAHRPVKIFA